MSGKTDEDSSGQGGISSVPSDKLSITLLRNLKKSHVDSKLAWYSRKSRWPGLAFRIVGVLVIVFSLGIPFLVSQNKWPYSSLIVSLASFLVAALTALNTFYGFHKTWESRIAMRLALEGLAAMWELEIAEAESDPDAAQGLKRATEVTKELLRRTYALAGSETSGFFAAMRFPATPGGK